MTRCQGFDVARQLAEEQGVAYGLCVVDGLYYIDTAEHLEELPVVVKFDYALKLGGGVLPGT